MRPLIYIQVNRGHFIARRLGSDKTLRRECAGLIHPRTLMGDFEAVQASFTAALKELLPRIRLLKPKGLVHLMPDFEGGYTDVERRAFMEAAEMAGIRIHYMCTINRPLTSSELHDAFDDRQYKLP